MITRVIQQNLLRITLNAISRKNLTIFTFQSTLCTNFLCRVQSFQKVPIPAFFFSNTLVSSLNHSKLLLACYTGYQVVFTPLAPFIVAYSETNAFIAIIVHGTLENAHAFVGVHGHKHSHTGSAVTALPFARQARLFAL